MKEVLMNRGPSRATAGQPGQGPRFSTSILEKAGFSVVVTDLEGKITYWNKRAEEMRGWRSEEVIGRPIFYVIPPESRELANSIMTKIAKSGSWTGESEAIRKDGTRFQTMSSMEALEDWNGRVVGMIEASVEVTERTEMEKRLRASETKFRGIAERSFDGIFTLDMDGILTYASPAFAKLFGYDQTEVIGISLAEQIPESEPESERIKLAQAFADVSGGKVIDGLEIEARRRDGSPIFVWVNVAPILDEGRVVGLQGVVRDLSKRREIEKSLHDTEEKFRGIAERSFDGIFTADAKGVYTYVSPAFAKLFGLDPSEMTGKSILERAHLRLESEPDQSRFLETFKEVLSGKAVEASEFEIMGGDGSRVFVEANASPVFGGGKIVGVQAVVRDITKRRQAEDELHFQASLLEQAGQSIMTVDLSGRVRSWNRKSEELFGMTKEEAVGKPTGEVMSVIDPDLVGVGISKALLQSGGWSGEVEFARKDGSRFPALVTATAVRNPSGLVVGYSYVTLDITESKQMQKSLHDSEEKFRGIAERSFDGIFLLDANGIVTHASPSLRRILGSKSEEMIGHPVTKYLPAGAIPRFTEALGELMKGRTIESLEIEGEKGIGSAIHLEVSASPIFDEGYSVAGIQGILRDVTQRKESERKLNESEEKFRGIAERSFDGIFTLDSEGNTTYASPSLFKLTGFNPEEVEGLPLLKFIPESSISKVLEAMGEVLEGQTINNFEVEGRRKDGSEVLLEVNATPVFDAKHSVTAIQGTARDVTEVRRAQEPKKLLASIIESMPIGMVSIGRDGTIVLWNPAAERIVGYSAKEMIGRPVSVLRPLGYVEEQTRVLETLRTTEGARAMSYEGKWVKKDGSQFDFAGDAFPIKDAHGKTDRFTLLFRDITAQKAAEESRRLLAAIVESAPDGMVSVGLDGIINGWNPSAERIFGYSSKEMIGHPLSILAPEDRLGESAQIVERVKKEGGVFHFESIRARKDGSLFDFAIDAFPTRDLSGTIVGVSSFFNDITARKAAEEKIRSLQEARSRFISAATHELKTPLVSIKGYADLAVSGSLGEVSKPLAHGLEVVGRNVERMLNLIQELLEIERMDNGKVEISKEVVDLTEVIRESIDNLKPIMESKKLEVDAVLPEVATLVMGDKVRLNEVMDNLLVNAVKFTPEEGKLHVVVAEEEGQIRVSVADSGIGISPTSLANIFEPFSKIPKSSFVDNQEVYGLYSTGLGLAVTKRLVELHGGRIWAESPGEGQGSTFIFTLSGIPSKTALTQP